MRNVCVSVFQDYIDAHPETIVLDPLPAIRTLLDRCKSYQLIHRIESCMQGKMFDVNLVTLVHGNLPPFLVIIAKLQLENSLTAGK